MFKHALTHDVAYESVLRDRRRASSTARSGSRSRSCTRTGSPSSTRRSRTTSAARRTGSARSTTTSARRRRRPSSFANRAVIAHCRAGAGDRRAPRRRRAPTSAAARSRSRRALACFYVSEFDGVGRSVRARGGAQRRADARAASTLVLSRASATSGATTTSARDAAVEAALDLARAHELPAAGEALARRTAGIRPRRLHRRLVDEAAPDDTRRSGRSRPRRRRGGVGARSASAWPDGRVDGRLPRARSRSASR